MARDGYAFADAARRAYPARCYATLLRPPVLVENQSGRAICAIRFAVFATTPSPEKGCPG